MINYFNNNYLLESPLADKSAIVFTLFSFILSVNLLKQE